MASGVQAQSFYSARTADGIHRINAFRRLSVMPAFVVVGLGEADYLAQWRDDVRKATFLALAFLVVSTLAGWLLWRFISANERASQRSRILLQNASDGIHITDLEGRVIEASDAFCRMLGHPYADLLGMNVSSWDVGQATTTWPQPKGPAPAEAQIRTSETEYRRADGSTMPVEITSYPLELDGRPVVFHSARDISARRKSEEEVRKLAFFDPLTELPNRRLLIQRLGETLSESTGTRVKGALLFIDLDNFKTVNDTAGHYEGDRLLVRVARTLVECVSRNDVVARIGGDEFVVLLARLGTDEGTVTRLADEVARRILNTLATSLGSGDGEYLGLGQHRRDLVRRRGRGERRSAARARGRRDVRGQAGRPQHDPFLRSPDAGRTERARGTRDRAVDRARAAAVLPELSSAGARVRRGDRARSAAALAPSATRPGLARRASSRSPRRPA